MSPGCRKSLVQNGVVLCLLIGAGLAGYFWDSVAMSIIGGAWRGLAQEAPDMAGVRARGLGGGYRLLLLGLAGGAAAVGASLIFTSAALASGIGVPRLASLIAVPVGYGCLYLITGWLRAFFCWNTWEGRAKPEG